MVHQQRKKFAENISDHEDQAQHRDRKCDVHQQLAANKPIDQLHLSGQILAQSSYDAESW